MSDRGCDRFERATRRWDPEAWAALEAHAAGCAECRARIALWRQIEEAAPALRKAWASPGLFPRIAGAIGGASSASPSAEPAVPAPHASLWRFLPAAAAAALVVVSMVGLRVFRDSGGREPLGRGSNRDPLLTEQALSEVESAEAVYLASIERLSRLARPRLEDSTSALAAGYREKLLLLDSEIAEMRGEIESNRFNTHLRKELLAMYREKQRTLQDLMKGGQS
ncbi:MAG: hypothetical protein ACM3SU_09955 [Acidobacteriota bacterium]